jgi:hypothetical protein
LGTSVGLFKEKIEFGVDEGIMQKLLEGRERTRLAEEQALAFLKGKRMAETSTNPQVLLAEDIARFYVAHPFRLLAGSGRNEF